MPEVVFHLGVHWSDIRLSLASAIETWVDMLHAWETAVIRARASSAQCAGAIVGLAPSTTLVKMFSSFPECACVPGALVELGPVRQRQVG